MNEYDPIGAIFINEEPIEEITYKYLLFVSSLVIFVILVMYVMGYFSRRYIIVDMVDRLPVLTKNNILVIR